RWHAVASWTWDAQDETCGICRMAFDGCCPDCKLPGDDCPLIWGACNHAFHLHCILKWVNSQTSQAHCPMCRREWQFKDPTMLIWRRPSAGAFKCNFDAARYEVDQNIFCIGACLCNEHSMFVEAFMQHFGGTPDIHEPGTLIRLQSIYNHIQVSQSSSLKLSSDN
ncbi:anaphase-promoting complex subunit 11-like protein, partial [Trifolium pratense]